jgi:hypothetical protein
LAGSFPTDSGVSFEQVSWTILNSAEPLVGGSYDGSAWTWRLWDLERGDRLLTFQITGTAMSMSDDALPQGGAVARASAGRSEVERILSWDTPRECIELGSMSFRSRGGTEQPGP